VRPAVRAYVHREMCVMFTTMPYSLDPAFLGGEDSAGCTFEPRVSGNKGPALLLALHASRPASQPLFASISGGRTSRAFYCRLVIAPFASPLLS